MRFLSETIFLCKKPNLDIILLSYCTVNTIIDVYKCSKQQKHIQIELLTMPHIICQVRFGNKPKHDSVGFQYKHKNNIDIRKIAYPIT